MKGGAPRSYEEQVAAHARAHREASRDTRRDFWRLVLDLAITVAGGLTLLGWAFHSSEMDIARAFWWAGHAFWAAGMTVSAIRAYKRSERRGDR